MEKYIDNYLRETVEIAEKIDKHKLFSAANALKKLKTTSGRLFIIGVGGSAANASHAVNDFRKIAGIEAYAPTDNVAEFTARINDDGWDTSFAAWLQTSKLSTEDMVMVFSVGGGSAATSQNIVAALKLAKQCGAATVSVVSRDGGYAATVSDVTIKIPVVAESRITPHAEGWQGIVWHLLVNLLREGE